MTLSLSLVLALLAGCGRLSFEPVADAPPDAGDPPDAAPLPLIELDDSVDGEVRVIVPGQLELLFRRADVGQPSQWIDPTFQANTNLAGDVDLGTQTGLLLFAPLGLEVNNQPFTIDEAVAPNLTPGRLSSKQVQLIMTWAWFTPQARFDVTTSYIIGSDGLVDVTAVAIPDRPVEVDAVDYAYTTVSPEQAWELLARADNAGFSIRSGEPGAAPASLEIVLEQGNRGQPIIESDGQTNLHFTESGPTTTTPDQPVTVHWIAQFGIGDLR